MKEFEKIDFKRVKSSYLEDDLKIKNVESVKSNLHARNGEILEKIRNETNFVGSLESLISLQSTPNGNFECEDVDIEGLTNWGDAQTTEGIVLDGGRKSGEGKEGGDGQLRDLDEEDDGEKEGNPAEAPYALKKVSDFFSRTKDACKSLNLEKLFLCKNGSDLFNDKSTDINIGDFAENNHNMWFKGGNNLGNPTFNKVGIMKMIEKKLKSGNTFAIENIYNVFRGTINDFMDVYLQKENEDVEFIYSKLYETDRDINRSSEVRLKGERKNIQREDVSGKTRLGNKKYNVDNNIFNMPGENVYNMKRENTPKESKHEVKRSKQEGSMSKRNCYNTRIRRSSLFSNSTQEKIKTKWSDPGLSENSPYYQRNVVQFGKSDTIDHIAKGESLHKKLTSNDSNNALDAMDEKSSHQRDNSYIPDINKFEYSNMISDYLYNQKEIKKKVFSSKPNHDRTFRSYGEKDKLLDTQVNDKNIFDISPLTQKYKYRSNIILTINKIKNVERVIEINLSITDVQLKIPGMRVENVILPYKYANELLTIRVRTLNESGEDMKETEKGKNNREENGKREENCRNNNTPNEYYGGAKKTPEREGCPMIRCYYVFIPLNNIKEEVINKRLILIDSKNKEMYEKENLLPDTLYLIQSKNLSSMHEKHIYLSIKKCLSGIHFYPKIDHENVSRNINKEVFPNVIYDNSIFTPTYVSVYNDDVDREIGKFINENHLIRKIKIDKLPEKGHYVIDNSLFHFFFSKENILYCIQNDRSNRMNKCPRIIEPASNLFNLMCNNFLTVKSFLDLFPPHIFPLIEDVDYFDFIEKDEFLKLRFILHFLAITENICMNLCSIINLHTNVQSIFHNNLRAVKIKDQTEQGNYFTFLYTSYEDGGEPTGYYFNYAKPFIFRFQEGNNIERTESRQTERSKVVELKFGEPRGELPSEPEHELRHELRNEVQNEAQHEKQHDIQHEAQREMNNKLMNEMRYEVKDEVRYKVKHKMNDELRDEVKKELRNELNDNDLFIYDYARKQSIFLYNAIKDYDEIKSIQTCYDKEKNLYYTSDHTKKYFQNFYLNILHRYNQLAHEDKCHYIHPISCGKSIEKRESAKMFGNNNSAIAYSGEGQGQGQGQGQDQDHDQGSIRVALSAWGKQMPLGEHAEHTGRREQLERLERQEQMERTEQMEQMRCRGEMGKGLPTNRLPDGEYKNREEKKQSIISAEESMYCEKRSLKGYSKVKSIYKDDSTFTPRYIEGKESFPLQWEDYTHYSKNKGRESISKGCYYGNYSTYNKNECVEGENNNKMIGEGQRLTTKKDLNHIINKEKQKKEENVHNSLHEDLIRCSKDNNRNVHLEELYQNDFAKKYAVTGSKYCNDSTHLRSNIEKGREKNNYIFENDNTPSIEHLQRDINYNHVFTPEHEENLCSHNYHCNQSDDFLNKKDVHEYEIMDNSSDSIDLRKNYTDEENSSTELKNNSFNLIPNSRKKKNDNSLLPPQGQPTYLSERDEFNNEFVNFDTDEMRDGNSRKQCKLVRGSAKGV
ncbi:conserved Plasmodium protein, unknown function [Plasmodium ovale curtisi]|uniref:Uncharacterized protein n=1 Tax=Plasmodium ovale curtisi TaxID=864141 RepID=A0A1A8WN48_PLAOA|nr:conserved Plasmodium protein, unknown function [Plasmodium ovale curtisi]